MSTKSSGSGRGTGVVWVLNAGTTIVPSDYTYAFHSQGISFLVTSLFAQACRPLQPLILRVGERWTVYLPKKAVATTLTEGLRMVKSPQLLETWADSFRSYLQHAPPEAEKLAAGPLTAETWRALAELLAKVWTHYQKTEWFYTDRLYTEEVPLPSRKTVEELKFQGRATMNALGLLPESPLQKVRYRLAEALRAKLEDIDLSSFQEIERALTTGSLEQSRGRKGAYGILVQDDKILELSQDGVRSLDRALTSVQGTDKEIRGVVATRGRARGPAAVIPTLYDDIRKMTPLMERMPLRAILVATTTSPELLPAIRKAAAIVTDQGGLGSHAAIVSSELGIPCIVGTRFATEAIHDGDLVEVDAEKGVVRVLKRGA